MESYTIPEYNWLSANEFFDSYPNVKVDKPSDMEIIEYKNAKIVVKNRAKDQKITICDYESNYLTYKKKDEFYATIERIILITVPIFVIVTKMKK